MARPSDLPFDLVTTLFQRVQGARGRNAKARHLARFRQTALANNCEDNYAVYRLLLPEMDMDRNYMLKESALVSILVKACNIAPASEAATRAASWKQREAKGAGNFAVVMEEYLFRNYCGKTEGTAAARQLTIGQVNEKLEDITNINGQAQKAEVFSWLLLHTAPNQMKWIIHIILKDLKIGLSKHLVLSDFHPDAEEYFTVRTSLKTVVTDLCDRNKRLTRKDIRSFIQPGKPVEMQMAKPVKHPQDAFSHMKGSQFAIETKFDGECMQVHRDGQSTQWYSRRAIDHKEESSYNIMDAPLFAQTTAQRVILDCELVVWNKKGNYYEPFGGLKQAVNAARVGRSPEEVLGREEIFTAHADYQPLRVADVLLVYVAFDILYLDDQSVIHLPLRKRHKLLGKVVQAAPASGFPVGTGNMYGVIVPLMPGVPLPSGMPGSRIGTTSEDIAEVFEAMDVREEGIIVKDLGSVWAPRDRRGTWVKLKPDYVHNSEIDAVIIAGCHGTGRRGGGELISEYIIGLADGPRGPGGAPPRFLSFAKVATGVSDEERRVITDRLRPYLADASKTRVPRCYQVTNHPKSRPHMWVTDPTQSIVLQITADVRVIKSRVWATQYSLRFPRIQRIRWDKSPFDAQTVQDLRALVHDNQGALVGPAGTDGNRLGRAGKKRSALPARRQAVEHLRPTEDVGEPVPGGPLAGSALYFCDYGTIGKATVEALVARLGGMVYQSFSPSSVTHVLASRTNTLQYKLRTAMPKPGARQLHVIYLSWLLECGEHNALITLHPHHLLFLSSETLKNVPGVDAFGDPYFEKLEPADVAAIVNHHGSMTGLDLDHLARVAEGWDDGEPAEARDGRKAYAVDVVAAVEAMLQDAGLATKNDALLRGCHACLLRVGVPVAPEEAAARVAVAASKLRHICLKVRLKCGQVTDVVDVATTHLVILGPEGIESPPSISARDLLALVNSKGGGRPALASLYRQLAASVLQIVSGRWLQKAFSSQHAFEQQQECNIVITRDSREAQGPAI